MNSRHYPKLELALKRGEPLVSFTITFTKNANVNEAVGILNNLADDFFVFEKPWYNDLYLRIGSATKPALERIFGWVISREKAVQIEVYYWETKIEPSRFPKGLEDCVEIMELSQPDAGDDGQFYEWK